MLRIFPNQNVADAAIRAYERGNHLKGVDCKVVEVPGRDEGQYAKALRINKLRALALEARRG